MQYLNFRFKRNTVQARGFLVRSSCVLHAHGAIRRESVVVTAADTVKPFACRLRISWTLIQGSKVSIQKLLLLRN